jgi:ParB family chromosome partitioning protein
MGDLSELLASRAEQGIIEPILVRQRGRRFQIVAGERRYQAAVQVGLREIPIVIREVDDNEIIEVALVENLQRKDLTPFEESEALHSLATRCSYTHEDMARRLGKSRTSITESLSLNNMPDEVKNLCRLADIHAKSLLLEIVRQEIPENGGFGGEDCPRRRRDPGSGPQRDRQTPSRPPKAYVFSYKARPKPSSSSCDSTNRESIQRGHLRARGHPRRIA